MGNVAVTGANRGIGLELCQQFVARGDHVWGLCREASPELKALGVHVLTGVDVAVDSSIEGLSRQLGSVQLDVLVNNAGILRRETLEQLDIDSIREQFLVNTLGPLRVTVALRAHLRNPSKVAIITSRMGSIADNTSGSRYGYRMSKAAANIAGVSLAHDLREQGVAVALLHPGFVQTEMTGGAGFISADIAARGLIARIDELTLATSGTFWHADGSILPW